MSNWNSKKLKTAVPREPVRATRDARAGSAPRVVAALRRFSFIHSFRFRGARRARAREGGGVVVPWGRVYSSPSRSSIGFDDRIGYGSDTPN